MMQYVSEWQPAQYSDVEVRVGHGRAKAYYLELRTGTNERFSAHASEPPPRADAGETPARDYGYALFDWLFRGELRGGLRGARWSSESYTSFAPPATLRLRLWLDPAHPELHSIFWEMMRDPDRDEPLALTTVFSRVMNVETRRVAPLRGRAINMLLMVSRPRGLDEYGFSRIDMDLEEAIVKGAVGPLGQRLHLVRAATAEGFRHAAMSPTNIVHLLAHAAGEGAEGHILLGGEDGVAEVVSAGELAEILTKGEEPPYLVYLAVPLSGNPVEGEVFLQLAQRLVERGVQAAVVLRSPMAVDRLRLFTQRFYSVLVQSGSVDQAIADARVAAYTPDTDPWAINLSDWACPVLYLRSGAGQLFQVIPPQFDDLVSAISIK